MGSWEDDWNANDNRERDNVLRGDFGGGRKHGGWADKPAGGFGAGETCLVPIVGLLVTLAVIGVKMWRSSYPNALV